MEDLSSLEGPPIQDGRFAPVPFAMSPVSPEGTYDPSRGIPLFAPGSVSPLTTATRSLHASSISSIRHPLQDDLAHTISNENRIPLRNSRSHSALRDTTDVPPRPASTDSSVTTPAPFWLLVNGRLVWVEDLKLWVLWDDVVASHGLSSFHSNRIQQEAAAAKSARANRGVRTWKSLPPLPHEIHHLLPPASASTQAQSPEDSSRLPRPGMPFRDRYYSQPISPTNAHIQLQWASLAGQLAPHVARYTQPDARATPEFVNNPYQQAPTRSLPQSRPPQAAQQGNNYWYYT